MILLLITRLELRDTSAQVQFLLSEVQHLSQGLPPLSTVEQARFKKLALQGASIDVAKTDTDRIINQRLVLFSSIKSLQEQNAELLKVTRQLGQKMENEEERSRMEAEGQKSREVLELRQTLETYRDEVKSLSHRAEAFIKERDMFRRMLQNRGNIPQEEPLRLEDMDQPMGESTNMALLDRSQTQNNSDKEDYAQLLRELQQSFDAYRLEATTDHSTLRDQGKALQLEKNDLQVHIARVNGQLELSNGRTSGICGSGWC